MANNENKNNENKNNKDNKDKDKVPISSTTGKGPIVVDTFKGPIILRGKLPEITVTKKAKEEDNKIIEELEEEFGSDFFEEEYGPEFEETKEEIKNKK